MKAIYCCFASWNINNGKCTTRAVFLAWKYLLRGGFLLIYLMDAKNIFPTGAIRWVTKEVFFIIVVLKGKWYQ